MRNDHVKKLALAGLLTAVAVTCSAFTIPVGAARCMPVQHMVNLLGGVLLGPGWSVGMAFVTSVIRVAIGTGSLLAFPGSMVGALCCGLVWRMSGSLVAAMFGEALGTGVLGALCAWPVAVFLVGNEAAVFAYVIPFLISASGGALLAGMLLAALRRSGALKGLLPAASK
ncbi:MAG: energy coupling factor transporter S component ThiW [Clostridia bacterium]|nr:energy coupling factor transporter S component ThiW [Clostridia bacterium]